MAEKEPVTDEKTLALGDIFERGQIPCKLCGSPHDAMVVEKADDGTIRHISWEKDGHYYAEDMSRETIVRLWRLANAASNVEDMLEAPASLGAHSRVIAQLAIDAFREALAALKEEK